MVVGAAFGEIEQHLASVVHPLVRVLEPMRIKAAFGACFAIAQFISHHFRSIAERFCRNRRFGGFRTVGMITEE